jgi:hypothetical protein
MMMFFDNDPATACVEIKEMYSMYTLSGAI